MDYQRKMNKLMDFRLKKFKKKTKNKKTILKSFPLELHSVFSVRFGKAF